MVNYKLNENLIKNKDNLGNELSQEQIAYFENSKIVNDKDELIVCYHGSPTPNFTEFNPSKAKSQFGKYKFGNRNVNYFTTDKRSAASYTEFGYDNGTIFECYINITNPFIVDNKSEEEIKSHLNIKDDRIRQRQIELFDRIFNKWKDKIIDYSDFRFDELNKDLSVLNLELRPSDQYEDGVDPMDIDLFDLYNLGSNSFMGAEHPIFYQYYTDELFSDDMYDELRNAIIGEDENDYYFSTDDIVRYVLSLDDNYDGIIIKDIHDSKEMFSDITTDIITLNSSNQIKSIKNKKPTNSNNINESSNDDLYDIDFDDTDYIDPEIDLNFDFSNDNDKYDIEKEKDKIKGIRKENSGKTYNIPKETIKLWQDEPERYGWLRDYIVKKVKLDDIIKANGLDNENHGMFSRRVDRWGEEPILYYYNRNKEDWLYSPIRVRKDLRIIDGGHRLYALWNNGYEYAEVLMPKGLNESLLLEVSRRQLIDKSKKGRAYSPKNQALGKNRWERKKWSKVANTTREFNSIDMNTFFKKDILIVNVPVNGETDNYIVKIKFEGVLKELQNNVKRNNNTLDYRTISQSLSRVFNNGDIYINCNCMDFRTRFNHWSTVLGYSSSKPELRPNRFDWTNSNDDMGSACKHGNLVLSNLSWMMKVASVINNYIHYAETFMQRQFADIIFPVIYGVKYPDAVQLGMFDRMYIKHSKGVIDAINEYGKTRGRFKPNPNKVIEPKAPQGQQTIFDKDIIRDNEPTNNQKPTIELNNEEQQNTTQNQNTPTFKQQSIFDYGVDDVEEVEVEKQKRQKPQFKNPSYSKMSIFDLDDKE